MLKKPKCLLNIFKRFKIRKTVSAEKNSLPFKIDGEEKILRAVYSPINLTRNKKRLNNGFYKPQAGSDEISVNRLDYTTPTFVKKLALMFENTESRRNYFGFSLLKAFEIREIGFDVVYTPLKEPVENPFHSDIKIGYMVERGVQLPSEVSYKIKKMTEKSRLYKDLDPNSEEWVGDELI